MARLISTLTGKTKNRAYIILKFSSLFAALEGNCADIYKAGERRDGMHTIKPDNLSAFEVFCDQTGAGGG